jgi:hypothetical protein
VAETYRRYLNDTRNAEYEIVERPDTKERTKPDIDYVLRDRKTGHEIALEVSSVWRSEDAGKEDAYIDKWFARVSARVVGRVSGAFRLALPISVPPGVTPEAFGDALVDTIQRNADALARYGRSGKNVGFDIAGMSVRISQVPGKGGSSISYGRTMPGMDDFPERVKKCLDDKAMKLKKYSDAGMETHIAIFNTMGIAMSPIEAENITKAQLGPAHEHVTHIGLVAGMPPDDAWVQVIR